MHLQKLDNLPYPTCLIPLTAFFAGPEEEQFSLSAKQADTLKAWFWRALFSHRYSSGTKRNLETDIKEARKLRTGDKSSLGSFDASVPISLFSERRFLTSSVDTKVFVLMLANNKPRSLVNGTEVQIGKVLSAGNRSEFHHLYPQAFLKKQGLDNAIISCLANFCVISASDNKRIGSKKPSLYKAKLHDNLGEILASNIIPESLFGDDFATFVADRSAMLVKAAQVLIERPNFDGVQKT